jgi:peptidoglycan/xylan/chitin deacetylase (PgdA/CDA1 family)
MASSWRKIPFLRWSFWRLVFGMKHLTTQWQVEDGREARLAEYVLVRARHGDAADVIDRSMTMRSTLTIRSVVLLLAVVSSIQLSCNNRSRPEVNTERVVVLTFDDAVKSHRTVVAPLLRQLGFRATFFVTHRWMDDFQDFLSWQEIAEICQMGFEIGNHSWTHTNFSIPKNGARLSAELTLVENELRKVGVPRPVSFAYSGNAFGPEAVEQLTRLGYRFGRRGTQPEADYRNRELGPLFDPRKHHRLLIPTTGNAQPNWTLDHFRRVVDRAEGGRIVVLQFHGVPDLKHPWVHTSPELFRQCMDYLKQQGFRVIALRDLDKYLSNAFTPADPMTEVRYPTSKNQVLELPAEMVATQREPAYWLENMLRYHQYAWDEAAEVIGRSDVEVRSQVQELHLNTTLLGFKHQEEVIRVLPYPGGRHPRIGSLEGAVLPHRGTKASVFLPWDPSSYIVVDIPEAIFSNLGLAYLAHTHIPTIWDARNLWLENIDWNRAPDGSLSTMRTLPNQITFGASIRPYTRQVEMELWLYNSSTETLSGLRTQICVMLKGAKEFSAQTNDNKLFRTPLSAVRSSRSDRWVLTAWEGCGRAWGNADSPCMHADPVLPDCPPGQTVRRKGRLWFYEGKDIESELQRAEKTIAAVWTRSRRPNHQP